MAWVLYNQIVVSLFRVRDSSPEGKNTDTFPNEDHIINLPGTRAWGGCSNEVVFWVAQRKFRFGGLCMLDGGTKWIVDVGYRRMRYWTGSPVDGRRRFKKKKIHPQLRKDVRIGLLTKSQRASKEETKDSYLPAGYWRWSWMMSWYTVNGRGGHGWECATERINEFHYGKSGKMGVIGMLIPIKRNIFG